MTTCIHNLFSGSDRWPDLYGECVIKCRKKWKETTTPAAAVSAPSANKKERPLSVCQIEFLSGAGSYWSSASKRHEVRGTIKDDKGTAKIDMGIVWNSKYILYVFEKRDTVRKK